MVSVYGIVDPLAVVAERSSRFEQNMDTSNSLFSAFFINVFPIDVVFCFLLFSLYASFDTIVCLLG